MLENGVLFMSVVNHEKYALPLFLQYQAMYKRGRYFRESQFHEALCYLKEKKPDRAKRIYEQLKGGTDAYEFFLLSCMKEYEEAKQHADRKDN